MALRILGRRRGEALRGAKEERLDDAVADELERLADEGAFDGRPSSAGDPHALRVGARHRQAPDARYLVLWVAKRRPNGDALRVEFHQRLRG